MVSIVFSLSLLMASSLVFAVAKQDVSAREGVKGVKAAQEVSKGAKTGAKAAKSAEKGVREAKKVAHTINKEIQAGKALGKKVTKVTTRERLNGKGKALNIELEDGSILDINPDRVKMKVPEPRNPNTGMKNVDFSKGSLPKDTEIIPGSGGFKRSLTPTEKQLFSELGK